MLLALLSLALVHAAGRRRTVGVYPAVVEADTPAHKSSSWMHNSRKNKAESEELFNLTGKKLEVAPDTAALIEQNSLLNSTAETDQTNTNENQNQQNYYPSYRYADNLDSRRSYSEAEYARHSDSRSEPSRRSYPPRDTSYRTQYIDEAVGKAVDTAVQETARKSQITIDELEAQLLRREDDLKDTEGRLESVSEREKEALEVVQQLSDKVKDLNEANSELKYELDNSERKTQLEDKELEMAKDRIKLDEDRLVKQHDKLLDEEHKLQDEEQRLLRAERDLDDARNAARMAAEKAQARGGLDHEKSPVASAPVPEMQDEPEPEREQELEEPKAIEATDDNEAESELAPILDDRQTKPERSSSSSGSSATSEVAKEASRTTTTHHTTTKDREPQPLDQPLDTDPLPFDDDGNDADYEDPEDNDDNSEDAGSVIVDPDKAVWLSLPAVIILGIAGISCGVGTVASVAYMYKKNRTLMK